MILWYNCKITDNRRTSTGSRFGLTPSDRFDVARYGFASFAVLEPLVSKFIFTLELADDHVGREDEMEEWIRANFPADKLSIRWSRCNTIEDWEAMQPELNDTSDSTIYLAGNEDYIFLDSNINMWANSLTAITNDPDPHAVFFMCHYPEILKMGYTHGSLSADRNFSVHCEFTAHAMQVIKLDHYFEFLAVNKPLAAVGDRLIYMMDNFYDCPGTSKVYCSTKELCRHFDGYNHVGANPGVIPPIAIPPGFFKGNMTIKYGFDDRDSDCININPLKNFATIDPNGTDYKFTLEDVPLFWRSRIKQIIVADNIDYAAMSSARNEHYKSVGRAMTPLIPDDWFVNHLI